MSKGTIAGFIIIALTIASVVFFKGGSSSTPGSVSSAILGNCSSTIDIVGDVGGEKIGFLSDSRVISILKDKYCINVKWTKRGGVDMARDKTTGRDFIFPSSSVVTEMYKESGSPYKKIEKAFMSPLVIYTWDPIVNALSATGGVVSKKDNYYRVDMKGLIGLIAAGKKWNEYGVDSDKRIYISTTDPNKSTSGNLFTGLLSYILNDSAVVDDATLPTITKQVRAYFGQEGYMESSSDDVFNNFMTMGYGAYPLLAGYESQLFSFMSEKPEFKDILQRKIKVLYPSPTVWSNHDVIAITDNGIKLINGLKDPEIQGIAWNTYGFRIGLIADGSKDGFTIPVDITNVIQMPKPYIINSLLTQ